MTPPTPSLLPSRAGPFFKVRCFLRGLRMIIPDFSIFIFTWWGELLGGHKKVGLMIVHSFFNRGFNAVLKVWLFVLTTLKITKNSSLYICAYCCFSLAWCTIAQRIDIFCTSIITHGRVQRIEGAPTPFSSYVSLSLSPIPSLTHTWARVCTQKHKR